MLESGIEQFLLRLFDTIGVDEVRETLAHAFIDRLREMGRRDG